MIRRLALAASLLVACALPARAQTHSHAGSTGQHHPAGHVGPDSAHHAAMHALMNGTWRGAITSAAGTSSPFELAIAHDSIRGMTLRTRAGERATATIATLSFDGPRMQWTQDIAGDACKATVRMNHATPPDHETIAGTMSCTGEEMTFVLRKTRE